MKNTSPRDLKRRLFFSFFVGAIFFALIIVVVIKINHGPQDAEAPVFLRKVLLFNEGVSRKLVGVKANSVNMPVPSQKISPRVNGDIGLGGDFSPSDYEVEIRSGARTLNIKMGELTKLPTTRVSTLFKCVEGWSEPVQYAGVKFSDFLETYKIGKKPNGQYFKYVGLETPDEEYYVSIDIESMLHPQTVLAYEMNYQPLSLSNGFPLRLVIPIKYGIKNLKRVGLIFFSDERPPDYWAERGYDWYAGL